MPFGVIFRDKPQDIRCAARGKLVPMLFWIFLTLVFAIVALALVSDYVWARRDSERPTMRCGRPSDKLGVLLPRLPSDNFGEFVENLK